ncbi:MAG: DUF371 domain-containing protein [Candidatus Thorarchaeota archaeon]|nr:DUF371 domain-containing protein [Candidatus Thorarchaeota archaeon]
MQTVRFQASGHQNIIGVHSTTLEITSEDNLTKRGTCIIGVNATVNLHDLDMNLKELASQDTTKIVLRMKVDGLLEEIIGWGASGLTYSDTTSMVARTSFFRCNRTVMVGTNKAASDLDRTFVEHLKSPDAVLYCELLFIIEH